MHARLRPTLATLAALLLATMTLALAPAAHAVTTYDDPQGEITRLTNAHRASHDGLGGLTRSSALDAVAQAWAEQLAATYAKAKAANSSASPTDALAHNPDYADQIPTGWTAAGENVAWNKGYSDPVSHLVTQWINSSGHHSNLASTKYTHMGAGYVLDQYGVSWGVQVFGRYTGAGPDLIASSNVAPPAGSDSLAVRHGNKYYIKDVLTSGTADRIVSYGSYNSEVFVGDWDGDGVDTLAVRMGNTFYVKNSLTSGTADIIFSYGSWNDQVLVGDWDGDGVDTLAVRRGNTYYLKNDLSTGGADTVISYGSFTSEVFVGDWNGSGADTLAVRMGNTFYVKNSLKTGTADIIFSYGSAGDVVLVGDWDADDDDTLTVRRGNTYYINNTLYAGGADRVVSYGRAGDAVLAGGWAGR